MSAIANKPSNTLGHDIANWVKMKGRKHIMKA